MTYNSKEKLMLRFLVSMVFIDDLGWHPYLIFIHTRVLLVGEEKLLLYRLH
jgi:hypothetical protein